MTIHDTTPLPDDENLEYLLHLTHTKLLVAIVQNRIDTKELAQKQLRSRGLNNEGLWVGFDYER
ncbi:MAG: hypothetical protein K1X55_10255 [Chitinophagales bacterium]|nr:hypothetical protein [Chitinophagales bacterium]